MKPPGGRLARVPLPPGTKPLGRTAQLARSRGFQGAPREGRAKTAATKTRGSSSGRLTPSAPAEFSAAVKLLVRKRAGRGDEFEALAECCGKWLGRHGGEYQHRAARGAGGCRDEVVNGPANCALMCPEHHRDAEDRDRHLGMDAGGFWLKHGKTPEFDPRNVPVMLHGAGGSGFPVFLAVDGLGPDGTGYLLQAPGQVAA